MTFTTRQPPTGEDRAGRKRNRSVMSDVCVATVKVADRETPAMALLRRAEAQLVYAFQPVVDVHSGEAFGFEALMRGFDRLGFADPPALLAEAEALGVAPEVEALLRRKAIERFAAIARDWRARLFFNTTAGALTEGAGATMTLLRRHGLPCSRFCLEVTENRPVPAELRAAMRRAWPERPLLAMDDFGTGWAGLRVLHELRPDLIKIDRFFVRELDADPAKRVMLGRMAAMARELGILVVAEGVETEAELRAVRELGCDLAQGYLLGRPSPEIVAAPDGSERVRALAPPPGPAGTEPCAARIARSDIQPVTALPADAPVQTALEALRHSDDITILPVVTENGTPLGVLHERTLRRYAYSPFGRALLNNRSMAMRLRDLVTPCAVVEAGADIDRMLEVVALHEGGTAVLVVENGRYLGLLDTQAIMRAVHERNLSAAADQNPLTRLAGNLRIAAFIAAVAGSDRRDHALIYFDFDHFKPFNDAMGFRQGDRAILMFAELLRQNFDGPDRLLGHVGGDDFFLGVAPDQVGGEDALRSRLLELLRRFASDAESFYTAETRREGMVRSRDRNGAECRVPLLAVSCGCLLVRGQRQAGRPLTPDEVGMHLATLKRDAKTSPDRFAYGTLD